MRGRRARAATAESSDSLNAIGLANLPHPTDDLKRHAEVAGATQRTNTLVLKNSEQIQQVALLLLIRGSSIGAEVFEGTIPGRWNTFSDELALITRPMLDMLHAASRWGVPASRDRRAAHYCRA